MKKNRFFDTIMIALILMIGFKMLYPDAFAQNITVTAGGSGSVDTDAINIIELPVIEEFYEYDEINLLWRDVEDWKEYDDFLNLNYDNYGVSDFLEFCRPYVWYCNSQTVRAVLYLREDVWFTVKGSPAFVKDGEVWYEFYSAHIPEFAEENSSYWFYILPHDSYDVLTLDNGA